MIRGSWIFVTFAYAACAPMGSPPPKIAATPAGAVEVWVGFSPPQQAGATVHLVHESGFVWHGAASPSGVTLQAPEGPCTLTLKRDGVVLAETALKLSRAITDYAWVLGP